MDIASLLAQGVQTRPAGMQQNALMQAQEFKQRQQQNALMQMQMQAAQEKRAQDQQNALMQRQTQQQTDAELARIQGGGQLDPVALLRLGVPREQIEFMANRGDIGRPKVARTVTRAGANGMPETVQLDAYGREVGGALPEAVKMSLENMGGSSVAVNPYALQPGQQFKRTQTPDSVASNATAMRGQNMQDARAREAAAQQKAGGGRTGPMSVTLQKELLESDDAVKSAGDVVRSLRSALTQNEAAYSGYLAKPRAVLRSNLPGDSASADATIDIDNLMTGQGLDSLKSIFGAAPTEGERKILMDMQASADKTPAQRKAIMERAIAAAERRATYASSKAQAIRSGTYLTEGVPALPEMAPAAVSGAFKDAAKEARYQAWKNSQGAK